MYCSLHKVDLVIEESSRKVYLQTDHRTVEQVDDEVELSVLFALTRTLMPLTMQGSEGAVVRYVPSQGLHPALQRVLVATGAEAEGHTLDGIEKVPPAQLADEAFATLGERLLARARLAADEDGLVAYAATLADTPTLDDGELRYWTNVVQLAAVTGEVIRARYGGHWRSDEKRYAEIPFVFVPDGDLVSLVNPVGKAMKFFRHGDAEHPRGLLRGLEDRSAAEGPMLPSIRPSSWSIRPLSVGEPLLANVDGVDVPWIAYGRDKPNTFEVLTKEGAGDFDLVALRREALANLPDVGVEIEAVTLSVVSFLVVADSYFACEKLLDVAFMQSLHARLETKLLAVALPEKGRLLVTNGLQPPEQMVQFAAIAASIHKTNEGGRAISPTVFLVSDGALSGVLRPHDQPAPTKKRGSFARLFRAR